MDKKYLNEFKKIAQGVLFLASVATVATYAVVDTNQNYSKLHDNIEKVRQIQTLETNYSYIKNISRDDFNAYITFLEGNKNAYDKQVSLTTTSLSKAKKQGNKKLEFISLDNIDILKNLLKEHQNNVEDIISNVNKTYYSISSYSDSKVSLNDTNIFISHYNLFLEKKSIKNLELDELIRVNFSSEVSGNYKYNFDNNMYSKMQKANEESYAFLDSKKVNKGMKL